MNNRQQPNRPMQSMAEQMATHGRYGDSMLVHMNPVEVQGLASLSPTGSLTTNPMTGQPEAFLPFLLPLLGSLGGSAMAGGALATSLGLGSLGATAMGAIGSGLATTAVTGDIKEGLMAGITGFGLGKVFEGAAALGSSDVASAATDLANVAPDAAALVADQAVSTGTTAAQLGSEQAVKDALAAQANAITQAPALNAMPAGQFGPASANTGSEAFRQSTLDDALFDAGQAGSASFKADPAEFMKNFGKSAMTKEALIPIAAGEGMRGQRMAEKDNEAMARRYEEEKAATLARSTAVRDSAIQLAQDDYGTSSYGGYAGGGLVSIDPNEYARQMNGVQTVGMAVGGPSEMGMNFAGMGNFNFGRAGAGVPAKTQQTLRPPNVVTSEQLEKEAAELVAQGKDPRAGFRSEINYFRKTPEEAGHPVPDVDPSGGSVDPSNPVDTGQGPISIGGKGGNFNPADFMESAGSTGPATGGRRDERPNFTMRDMAGLMSGNSSSLADESVTSEEVIAGKGSAKEAIDSIGMQAPIVPIYQPDPIMPVMAPKNYIDPASLYSDPNLGKGPNPMGRKAQMRFAGGQVLNMEAGGIASIDPQNMAMQDPLSVGGQQTPMMEDAEVMQVVSQVAEALAQGMTVDKLPPALIEKVKMAVQLFGEETILALIAEQSQPQQAPMSPQGQPSPEFQGDASMTGQSYNFQEGGPIPSSPETQLIEQTIAAVLGKLPQKEADVVINMFISEYGQEAFELLREQTLQSVVPNAQTEGVITGQGGGMDDMVNGMIGTEQPVAVSPGEYIVPADVVSGLGDGSTDGGVQELDGMLDRVRQTRTGTTIQPSPMRAGGALPA